MPITIGSSGGEYLTKNVIVAYTIDVLWAYWITSIFGARHHCAIKHKLNNS